MLRAAMTPVDHGPAWPARKLDTVRGASLRKTARKFLSSFSPGRRARKRTRQSSRAQLAQRAASPPLLPLSPEKKVLRIFSSSPVQGRRASSSPPSPEWWDPTRCRPSSTPAGRSASSIRSGCSFGSSPSPPLLRGNRGEGMGSWLGLIRSGLTF